MNTLPISIDGDIYLQPEIDKHLAIIQQAENNPNETYDGSGQNFSLEISAEKVTFFINEFDEEDGWPILSCPLPMFKKAFQLFTTLCGY